MIFWFVAACNEAVSHSARLLAQPVLALALLCAAALVRQRQKTPRPPSATARGRRCRARESPLGSPVEVTYRFTVAPMRRPWAAAPRVRPLPRCRRRADVDRRSRSADADRRSGSRVRQSNTRGRCSCRCYPVRRRAPRSSPASTTPATNERLKLANADRGDRSYQVADFELLPQTENVFLIFKDGWHPAEVAAENPAHRMAVDARRKPRWRSAIRSATRRSSCRSTTRAAVAERRDAGRGADRRAGARHRAGRAPTTRRSGSSRSPPPSSAPATWSRFRFVADRTFVPALEPGAKSSDTRELGVRVFHAFVQPDQDDVESTESTSDEERRAVPATHGMRFVVASWLFGIRLASSRRSARTSIVFANGRTMSVQDVPGRRRRRHG